MSYTDSFIVAYCCLSALFHLLEVGILDVVVRVRLGLLSTLEAGTALGTVEACATGLGTTCLAVHLGRGGLHDLVEVVDGVFVR